MPPVWVYSAGRQGVQEVASGEEGFYLEIDGQRLGFSCPGCLRERRKRKHIVKCLLNAGLRPMGLLEVTQYTEHYEQGHPMETHSSPEVRFACFLSQNAASLCYPGCPV